MKHLIPPGAALIATLAAATMAKADEAGFLQQLSGEWSGGGEVRMTPGSSPVNVTCEFGGHSTDTAATLDGTCTGMIFFSQQVGARIEVQDGGYVGSYVGSRRGTAALAGELEGDTLALSMQWPDHPPASMTLSNPAEGEMVLTTTETHPETGEAVITSELQLQRN